MRLVLDTNTALSGLIWQGVPGQLMDAAELEGVLQRTKFREPIQRLGVAVADLFDGYAALVERVEPADLGAPSAGIRTTIRSWLRPSPDTEI